MTREEIRLQVAISVIQGVLEAKHGVIGEVVPSVAVAIALRIADAFVEEWYRETKEQEQPESPSNLDEAAKEYNRNYTPFEQCDSRDIIRVFKAGAEWMAGQFQKIEGELVDWYETNGVDYCHGINTNESFEVPEGFYIKKKQL